LNSHAAGGESEAMPDRATRFAIYYVPAPATPLARFACTWLGRDVEDGRAVTPLAVDGLDHSRHAELTADPRFYGFHATLKPPFRLADGCDEAGLLDAVKAYAAAGAPVRIAALRLATLGHFMALVPEARITALDALATDCVRTFDRFRAPPAADELARRRAAGLTKRQEQLLERWGYPYVMEEFHLHLTLTGRLDAADQAVLAPILARLTAPYCGTSLDIDALAVCVQPAPDEGFVVRERFALRGAC
jgi:putative phosphonate metabolism protein